MITLNNSLLDALFYGIFLHAQANIQTSPTLKKKKRKISSLYKTRIEETLLKTIFRI